MSEYATRKSDGKYIYIGSCDEMSCLRYEDRDKVKPQSRFGWNSKSAVMCLCGVKNEEREMKILYTYVGCNSKWSVPFPTIQHLILSEEMKMRLFRLCSSYWEERNPGKEYPDAMTRQTGTGKAKVSLRRCDNAFGDKYAVSIETADDDGQTDYFKTPESAFKCYTGY